MSLIFYGTGEVLDDNDNVFNGTTGIRTTPQTTQDTSGRLILFYFALPHINHHLIMRILAGFNHLSLHALTC